MKEIDGQLSLFDLFEPEQQEPPILLDVGQGVYVVCKGDVRKANVFNEKSWVCEDNDRGYRLRFEDGAYGCTWNSRIGEDVFFTKNDAMDRAEKYLSIHEVIRAEDIHPVRTVAYQYIRDIDNRTMTAFFSELDNGMIYIKEFMTYHHMMKAGKKEEAIKNFMEQQEFRYADVKQVEYEPVFKNMYRIRQKYDWDYAEAGHSYATG